MKRKHFQTISFLRFKNISFAFQLRKQTPKETKCNSIMNYLFLTRRSFASGANSSPKDNSSTTTQDTSTSRPAAATSTTAADQRPPAYWMNKHPASNSKPASSLHPYTKQQQAQQPTASQQRDIKPSSAPAPQAQPNKQPSPHSTSNARVSDRGHVTA